VVTWADANIADFHPFANFIEVSGCQREVERNILEINNPLLTDMACNWCDGYL